MLYSKEWRYKMHIKKRGVQNAMPEQGSIVFSLREMQPGIARRPNGEEIEIPEGAMEFVVSMNIPQINLVKNTVLSNFLPQDAMQQDIARLERVISDILVSSTQAAIEHGMDVRMERLDIEGSNSSNELEAANTNVPRAGAGEVDNSIQRIDQPTIKPLSPDEQQKEMRALKAMIAKYGLEEMQKIARKLGRANLEAKYGSDVYEILELNNNNSDN